jgi:hypothetical protein
MSKTLSNQTGNEIRVIALYEIKNKYKELIKTNPILQSDFRKLMKCIGVSESVSSGQCEVIIDHLLLEMGELIEDNLRMDDEGSRSISEQSEVGMNWQDCRDLKEVLEAFHKLYLG